MEFLLLVHFFFVRSSCKVPKSILVKQLLVFKLPLSHFSITDIRRFQARGRELSRKKKKIQNIFLLGRGDFGIEKFLMRTRWKPYFLWWEFDGSLIFFDENSMEALFSLKLITLTVEWFSGELQFNKITSCSRSYSWWRFKVYFDEKTQNFYCCELQDQHEGSPQPLPALFRC